MPLAPGPGACHYAAMTPENHQRPPSPRGTGMGGGVLIALGAIVGPIIGLFRGSATIGFLIGIGAGIVLAGIIHLRAPRG